MGQLLIIFSNMVLKELFLSAALVMYLIFNKFPRQVMFFFSRFFRFLRQMDVTLYVLVTATLLLLFISQPTGIFLGILLGLQGEISCLSILGYSRNMADSMEENPVTTRSVQENSTHCDLRKHTQMDKTLATQTLTTQPNRFKFRHLNSLCGQ